ncbi:hypothetical protein PAMP_009431 [Pampus punctatissimus]
MGSHRSGQRLLIMVHMLLMQMKPMKVQGVHPLSQKLRQLNEQFQQFRVLTQARLDMLALNQNRNSSSGLESRVQALNDHYHHLSQDLEHLKQSTTQEIEGLREWSRKLEKKSKRMEGRLALIEKNLRENRRHSQKRKPDLGQDFSNFTLELQNQEEKLVAIQVQRDELLVGLKGLHESLKSQELRVTRMEGRLGEILQGNEGGDVHGSGRLGEPINPNITPQEYEPPRRRQMHRGGRPGRILDGHTQHRPKGTSYPQTDSHSQAMTQNRNPPQQNPYQAKPNQPKHSKTQKQKHQPESLPQAQVQYPNPYSQSTDYLPQPEPHAYRPESHIQVQAQTQPSPIQQEQLQSRLAVPFHHAQSESYQPRMNGQDGEDEESNTKVKSSVIYDFLQLPLRQKIPARPVPKKDATICNVDSMLLFPSASVENYVTFSLSLPDLPELSVCLWLRVDTSHVGTLLSYATHDNDNQLVLYGRNSSVSSSFFPASHRSYSSSPFTHSSSDSLPSLDFVIGDPVYRRLPVSLLFDARWHHLCVLWSSIQGRFWHYNDRRLTSSGSNFRKGWEIPGGGSVVLGQEQDTVGGGFEPAEGFAGQVAGFRLWNRVLSPSEVEGVADGRGVPRGVVLSMEDIKEVHGESVNEHN